MLAAGKQWGLASVSSLAALALLHVVALAARCPPAVVDGRIWTALEHPDEWCTGTALCKPVRKLPLEENHVENAQAHDAANWQGPQERLGGVSDEQAMHARASNQNCRPCMEVPWGRCYHTHTISGVVFLSVAPGGCGSLFL